MLRNVNSPEMPVQRTAEDYVIRRTCVIELPSGDVCGAPIEITIPAGSPGSVVRLIESQRPECLACEKAREAAEELTRNRQLRKRRVELCGLPRTLRALTWEDYKVNDPRWPSAAAAAKAAQAWAAEADERKPGLLVHGPVGVGKTTLAAVACWELMLQRDVRWVSVPELLIKLGAAWQDKDRAVAIKVLTGKGALVLDDLDKVKPSLWVLQNLFTAIDSRYQSGAPMFVTSNAPPSQLVEYFAGRGEDEPERRATAQAIVSRLVEHCVVGSLSGPDRRRA